MAFACDTNVIQKKVVGRTAQQLKGLVALVTANRTTTTQCVTVFAFFGGY